MIGPLLRTALDRIESAGENTTLLESVAASYGGGEGAEDQLPVVIKPPSIRPNRDTGETWKEYRSRVETALAPLYDELKQLMGVSATPLLAGNALAAHLRPQQIEQLGVHHHGVDVVELDPLVYLETMDDAIHQVALPQFRQNHGKLKGAGVRVAVLDSGVDTAHPHLRVVDSVETCGESVSIPGAHGTHCAGAIASQDGVYPGIAPDVALVNIKVLRANGTGQHTFISRGIDEALDRDVRIMSLSLGFNQLPTWSQGGHGWSCASGHCPLCNAVDNAVDLDAALIVVAAGNEHQRATTLRSFGHAVATELGCPGQARFALTVGAISKGSLGLAPFSSRGPSADGRPKPDIVAPGVNITSTIPRPRNASGSPIASPPRHLLFGRMSGTSMATPIVAGAAALVAERQARAGMPWSPSSVRGELLQAVSGTVQVNTVGAGELDLSKL